MPDFAVVLRVPDNARSIPELAALLATGAMPGEYVTLRNTPSAGMGMEFVQVVDVNLTPIVLGAFDFLELVQVQPCVSVESPRERIEREVRQFQHG